ncbi:MAG: flagellar assembly protein FliH [Gammaproteobacteria bacterium]|nr:flagellar assembly protein FliH [Gammaproteobacteria bacterium]
MTTSKVIDADKLTAYERWELPLVNKPDAVTSVTPVVTAQELETIQQQAYTEGFELGQKEGFDQAKALSDKNNAALLSIIELLSEPLKNFDEDIVGQLAQLSMIVARQVVRRELHTKESEIVGVVREAMNALPASTRKIILNLHPEDAEIVRNAFSLSQASESEETRWKVVEDPMLTRGGCMISSENSRIDATVESRLNRVITTLLGGERETDA